MPTERSASVFVIAEAGVNHNGSVDQARRLIDVAAEAGADAVKFQSFRAASLVSQFAPRAEYQKRNQPGEHSQLEMLARLELDEPAQRALCDHAAARGIEFMSTPFDHQSLDFLADNLAVKRLKIGSGEITNAPLLLHAAHKQRPVILSTGMSSLQDVEAALGVLAFGFTGQAEPGGTALFAKAFASPQGKAALASHVTLLQCTSDYPAPVDQINLRAMHTLREAFGLPAGLSDHSAGTAVAVGAAALGAAAIEKHFTLDRNLPGPDHRASLEPAELKAMIAAIRDVEAALGTGAKQPTPAELGTMPVARRSLVAARDVKKGERFAAADIAAKRPGTGVSPFQYWDWIGRVAERDYRKDELL